MATVRFTPHLRRYFDLPEAVETDARTVADVLRGLEAGWPGIGHYITDEQGRLRQHVAIWVDGQQVRDRGALGDPVEPASEVQILQALSGG